MEEKAQEAGPKRGRAERRKEESATSGEKFYFSNRKWLRILAEFVGTYFVVFTIMAATCWITLTSLSPVYLGIVAFCAYAGAAAVFQGVSGAHFNPAVSFAMALSSRLSWLDALYYAIAQIAGAIAASGTLFGLLKFMPSDLNVTTQQWWELLANTFDSSASDRIKVGPGFAIVIELISAFIVMALVLKAVRSNGKPRRSYFFLSALGYGTATILASFFTGGGFNPAKATGAAIMAGAAGVPGVGAELWMFWIIPLLCAAVCALVNTIYCGMAKPGSLENPAATEEAEEKGREKPLLEHEDEVGAEEEGAQEE
ncbi:MAG: aquaporin [Aeriscardovia sp.]|nr:aquaporin [Aeriscardovia sp.]